MPKNALNVNGLTQKEQQVSGFAIRIWRNGIHSNTPRRVRRADSLGLGLHAFCKGILLLFRHTSCVGCDIRLEMLQKCFEYVYKMHSPNDDYVQFVNKKKRNKNFPRVLVKLVNKTIDKKIVACYNMVPKSPFSVFYLYLYYIDG